MQIVFESKELADPSQLPEPLKVMAQIIGRIDPDGNRQKIVTDLYLKLGQQTIEVLRHMHLTDSTLAVMSLAYGGDTHQIAIELVVGEVWNTLHCWLAKQVPGLAEAAGSGTTLHALVWYYRGWEFMTQAWHAGQIDRTEVLKALQSLDYSRQQTTRF